MTLEMKASHVADLRVLEPLLPVFLCYILSVLYVGIYWNHHHQLLKSCKRVVVAVISVSLHMLFWRSLLPFASGW